MIAIETNHQDLDAAKKENRSGSWYFIVTQAAGKPLSDGKVFITKGFWDKARPQAEVAAKAYGCVDDMDSIVLVMFTEY